MEKRDSMEDDQSSRPIEIPSRGRPRKRDVESFLHINQARGDLGGKNNYGQHQFVNQAEHLSLSELQRLQDPGSNEYMQDNRANDSADSITNLLGFNRPFSRTGGFSPNEGYADGAYTNNGRKMAGMEPCGPGDPNGAEKGTADRLSDNSAYNGGRSGDEQSIPDLASFLQEFKGETKGPQEGDPMEIGRQPLREDVFNNPTSFGSQSSPWHFQHDLSRSKGEYGRHEPFRRGVLERKPHEEPAHPMYQEGQGMEELNQRFRNGPFQARTGQDPYYEGSFANERHSFYDRRPGPYGFSEPPRIRIPEGSRGYPYLNGAFPASQMFTDREFNQDHAPYVNNQRLLEGADHDGRMMASLFPGSPTFRAHFQQRYMDASVQGNAWMNRKKRKSNPLLWQYIKSNQGLHPNIVHPSKYSSLDFIQGVDDTQKMYLGPMRKNFPERNNGNSIFPLFLNSNKGVTDEFKEVVQNFRNSVNELDFNNVTVQQLKSLMKEFGLNHTGKKNELIERLQDILKKIDGKEVHKPEEHVQEKPKEVDDFEFYFF
ncbi:SAP domain-containing protein [Encephalitozoon cuniculi]|nr:SAP domain-containing protein [Encephalitozoon cuniculi]